MLQRARTGGGWSDILRPPEVRLVGDRTALPLDRRVDRAAGRPIMLKLLRVCGVGTPLQVLSFGSLGA